MGPLAREFTPTPDDPERWPCGICAEPTPHEQRVHVLLGRVDTVAHESCVAEQERMHAIAPLAVEQVIRL